MRIVKKRELYNYNRIQYLTNWLVNDNYMILKVDAGRLKQQGSDRNHSSINHSTCVVCWPRADVSESICSLALQLLVLDVGQETCKKWDGSCLRRLINEYKTGGRILAEMTVLAGAGEPVLSVNSELETSPKYYLTNLSSQKKVILTLSAITNAINYIVIKLVN